MASLLVTWLNSTRLTTLSLPLVITMSDFLAAGPKVSEVPCDKLFCWEDQVSELAVFDQQCQTAHSLTH